MRRLFDYDDWANREEVRHLRSLRNPPPQAIKILAHIVGTEWLWLGRLRSETPAIVWPELTLVQIDEQLARLHAEWPREFGRTDVVTYVNSKGEPWTSGADDILMHVIIHGGYHRGQIATIVRQWGETPAYTDYIHWCRSGAAAFRPSSAD
ncbi:MAG TPA: DinB family protein [Thermoanaerobaculia bacterium]|nr:DinB family protein [Thermoanaerobaculia bacterium]